MTQNIEGLVASRGKGRKPVQDPIQKAKNNPRSLRAAITAKCYDCSCYQKYEVAKCNAKDCPLYKLRPWQAYMKPKQCSEEVI